MLHGTLDYDLWTKIYGDDVEPLAEAGSRILELHLLEGSQTLGLVKKVLVNIVPVEYRRYVAEKLDDGVPEQKPVAPLEPVAEGDDMYQEMIRGATRIELTEIYTSFAPDKVKDIPKLMEKYAGKEEKLLKVVERKYNACRVPQGFGICDRPVWQEPPRRS